MRFVFALLLAGSVSGAALAQQTDAERDLTENGRYALERSSDGYVRLDKRTGAVAKCFDVEGRLTCDAVPEQRQALEEEIGRLSAENESLRRRLADAERSGGATSAERPSIDLPSREDMDKVANFLGDLANRVGEFVGKVQEEFKDKQ